MLIRRMFLVFLAVSIIVAGCAGVTIHDDLNVPPGKIEGNQFTGVRYPFKVEVPQNWKMATEFPDFLKEMGYDRPGPSDKEVTELYIFNPATRSSIQIDFTPASPRAKFSQETIEAITTGATGSFKEELEQEYGKDVKAEIGPTTPFSLKGVHAGGGKSFARIRSRSSFSGKAGLFLNGLYSGSHTSTIAQEQQIPPSFLAKIVSQLSGAGLLQTSRGAHGGVSLAKSPEQISLLEVVEAIDGPIYLNECVAANGACTFGDDCPMRPVWCDAQAELVGRLKSTTFDEFVNGKTPLPVAA